MEFDLPELLVIACIAALSPILARVSKSMRVPLVVVELLLGMVVGPHGLGWVTIDQVFGFLSGLGLAFLFFLAGIELDVRRIVGRPLQLATWSWITLFALTLGVSYALSMSGFVHAPVLVAIALATTAMGILIPVLRERGLLNTRFGLYVLGAASIGEFGPVLLMSVFASQSASVATHLALMLVFVVASVLTLIIASRSVPTRIESALSTALHMNAQFAVRLSVVVLVALVVVAGMFGLDIVLGAFTAGMLIGILTRGQKGAELRERIETLGFGFFIPLFFVSSGVKYDFTALFASSETLLRLPIFLALILVLRIASIVPWYRKDLNAIEMQRFVLYAATGLPIIVAVAEIGVQTGHMRTDNAAALVGAGMLSVLLFPALASMLTRKTSATT